ncbi:AAA family ATPase [Neisseria leonii]|uniref:AAA family ATPase n=1 Tax=Neisseria leonii TaxID=2995413 RepID=UPI00237AFC78|nr:AAA family ATPase [Neisseria sp. 3986]MDD9325540.1 AAA family ATPase [Neisseria sp. 3986]
MGSTLTEIAEQLKDANKKVHLIYAFNGTGKTRLSREFKRLISPKTDDNTENKDGEDASTLTRKKILYYSSFTEDVFYWDNDLAHDSEVKLKIQDNSFTHWVFVEQGLEERVTKTFQSYTDEKLTPVFNEDFSEVRFSYASGDDAVLENIKISKGEESNFIWSVFYSLLQQVISELNIAEKEERSTDKFDNLEYIFIDDPVSSLDENHLIELAIDVAQLIKSSQSELKFIVTTHNPLFYNVLHNEFKYEKKLGKKYVMEKLNDGSFLLNPQNTGSPFSYHLYLKKEIHRALMENQVQKYHFNLLRNLLEKTATFLGYERWGELLPKDPDGSNATENRLARMINFYSHSSHSNEDAALIKPEEKQILNHILKILDNDYRFYPITPASDKVEKHD